MITKKDVKDVILEATDTILEGVQNMFDEHNAANNKSFVNVESKIDTLSVRMDKVEDQLDGIKADISTVPTREEFNGLKSKMDKFALS
ncbi:MAG: hypothetical protein Q8P91_01855 [bacterium]|nr:hypothetical protein [bacterium]